MDTHLGSMAMCNQTRCAYRVYVECAFGVAGLAVAVMDPITLVFVTSWDGPIPRVGDQKSNHSFTETPSYLHVPARTSTCTASRYGYEVPELGRDARESADGEESIIDPCTWP